MGGLDVEGRQMGMEGSDRRERSGGRKRSEEERACWAKQRREEEVTVQEDADKRGDN